jgi:hypothetical protein
MANNIRMHWQKYILRIGYFPTVLVVAPLVLGTLLFLMNMLREGLSIEVSEFVFCYIVGCLYGHLVYKKVEQNLLKQNKEVADVAPIWPQVIFGILGFSFAFYIMNDVIWYQKLPQYIGFTYLGTLLGSFLYKSFKRPS